MAQVEEIRLENISKRYGAVQAVGDVSVVIRPGAVTAVVGENGAGKSTLVKILAGVVEMDSGRISRATGTLRITSARVAAQSGIGMVFQEMALVPELTVWENICLGWETVKGGRLARAEIIQRVKAVSEEFGLSIRPEARVKDLPVSLRQRVEILKVLYRDVDTIILDEPTGILTPQEAESLFVAIDALRDAGKSVVFISHKLNEVLRLADVIYVMRRGQLVAETEPGDLTPRTLAKLMLGEDLPTIEKASPQYGTTAIQLDGVRVRNREGNRMLGPFDLKLRFGEVLGVAGVAGSGQDELVSVLTGLDSPVGGTIMIADANGALIPYPWAGGATPRRLRDLGLRSSPSDRNEEATVASKPLWFSAIGVDYDNPRFYSRGLFDITEARRWAKGIIARGDVKADGTDVLPASLSGGNLQKFIVARDLGAKPRVSVLEEPTRGIDIGSAMRIRAEIRDAAEDGDLCVLVSSDLDELFQVSDRIAVLYNGNLVGVYEADSVTLEDIGAAMTGLVQS